MNLNYIHRLVKATGVQSGELILIHFWGEDSEKEIANAFFSTVATLAQHPFYSNNPVLLTPLFSVRPQHPASMTDTLNLFPISMQFWISSLTVPSY